MTLTYFYKAEKILEMIFTSLDRGEGLERWYLLKVLAVWWRLFERGIYLKKIYNFREPNVGLGRLIDGGCLMNNLRYLRHSRIEEIKSESQPLKNLKCYGLCETDLSASIFLKLAFHKFYVVGSFVNTLWHSNFLKAFSCKKTNWGQLRKSTV